ncbi:MAG: ISLre2 family transposase [Limnochordia bacterium]|jgi:hypothetical protein
MQAWINEQLKQGSLSFAQLEQYMLSMLMNMFRCFMEDILADMDDFLAATRDLSRYEIKDRRTRTQQTLFGEIQFKRRYYLDKEEQNWVCLLDQRLGLEPYDQISPGLTRLAVIWGTQGPSYRNAQQRLMELYGFRVLSHEGIRQLVHEVADVKDRERENETIRSDGQQQVNALFIEADGYYAYLQEQGSTTHRKRHENKIAIVHEGWEERQAMGDQCDYRLVNPTYIPIKDDTEDIWEDIRDVVAANYANIDGIPVIINGDGASWIGKGAEHFKQGIYQYDRFHVKKELRNALRTNSARLDEAYKALDKEDAQGVIDALRVAMTETSDTKVREEIRKLCKRFEQNQEALRDYRVRLREKGYEIDPAWRAMGAAESNMDRFKNRTGKRGCAWSKEGLAAILTCLAGLFEGTLVDQISRHMSEREDSLLDRIKAGVGRVTRQVSQNVGHVHGGKFPAIERGTEGYAKIFQMVMKLDSQL